MSERETVVELPFAADCCPCVEKLRTVLPLTGGIRDGGGAFGQRVGERKRGSVCGCVGGREAGACGSRWSRNPRERDRARERDAPGRYRRTR
jgi:hypothetical protein